MGSRLEQWLSGPRLVSARRLGATPRLVPPARRGATSGLGRALRRTTFQPVPPAALPIADALSLHPRGAGSEPLSVVDLERMRDPTGAAPDHENRLPGTLGHAVDETQCTKGEFGIGFQSAPAPYQVDGGVDDSE